jgi:hypothetical protein
LDGGIGFVLQTCKYRLADALASTDYERQNVQSFAHPGRCLSGKTPQSPIQEAALAAGAGSLREPPRPHGKASRGRSRWRAAELDGIACAATVATEP